MVDEPVRVIGLTGLPSSGKGEATLAFQRLAAARGWRAEHISFSDRIKDEARARGIAESEFTRDLLSRIGTELRETEGPGVLSKRIARMIEAWPAPKPELFIVEALRHVGEAETLREAFGDRFTLIAVDCDPRVIARRLIARRRPDESPDALRSEEHAVQLLDRELKGTFSALGPNVGSVAALADYRLDNNGTLEELRERCAGIFSKLV